MDTNLIESKFTEEQIQLITNTVAKGASRDELNLFLYRCKNMGLDPLKPGTIHFVKYGNSPGTIVVGIEGFRAKAHRSGKLSGIKRGVLRNDKGVCIGAWAEVYRTDWAHPAREEVSLAEYNTGKGPWAKMPETMIKKVAEAATLRMAFPDDLGGIYTQEEMHQAENSAKRVVPDQDVEGNGVVSDAGYITFGKYNKRKPSEVELDELRKTYARLEESISKKLPIVSKDQDTFARAKYSMELIGDYLTELEMEPKEAELVE